MVLLHVNKCKIISQNLQNKFTSLINIYFMYILYDYEINFYIKKWKNVKVQLLAMI